MSIKQTIKDKIIEPATSGRGLSILTGTIISVDEKKNICSVSYTRQDGKKDNRDNIPILLANKSIIDWFPKSGDLVLIQQRENVIHVIGPAYSNYVDIRNAVRPENDVLTNSFNYTLGGYLF